MISRTLLLSAIIGWSGASFLPPKVETPKPLTTAQLQAKAKYKSVSNVCNKKKKSKTVKELCERWEKHA